MNNCISIPGIRQVSYLTTDNLPDDITYRAVAGIPVSGIDQPISVTLTDEAVCEVEQQNDNNSQIEKLKLTFSTLKELPTRQRLAFVIRTMHDEYFIIGAKERPYPTVKVTSTTGQRDGDASVRKYEVSYTAKKTLATLAV